MEPKTATPERRSARERLLAAADELFYEGGIHTVGIDRIIERAGVAKASLYDAFGSKEELIRAYLAQRAESRKARVMARLATRQTARDKILAIFESHADQMVASRFGGCAFVRASAESQPGNAVKEVVDGSRAWTRNLFHQLADEAGAADPAALAAQLVLLYDGASVGAQMERTVEASKVARATAALLVDAAVASVAA